MLRRAIVQTLQAITSLKGIYQAFLAPANADRPYATVKLTETIGDVGIGFAGTQPIEVRIYDDLNSFVGLDAIEQATITALNGQTIVDIVKDSKGEPVPGSSFYVTWAPGGGDFVDDEKRLIGRLIRFEAALVHER